MQRLQAQVEAAISPDDPHFARTRLLAQGFKILLGPDVAFDAITSTLMSGKADSAFLAWMAQETLGDDRCTAVTAVSPSLAGDDRGP